MKEDGRAVVGEVAEASGGGFERLNQRVEPFGRGIGDAMFEVGEDAVEGALRRLPLPASAKYHGTWGVGDLLVLTATLRQAQD